MKNGPLARVEVEPVAHQVLRHANQPQAAVGDQFSQIIQQAVPALAVVKCGAEKEVYGVDFSVLVVGHAPLASDGAAAVISEKGPVVVGQALFQDALYCVDLVGSHSTEVCADWLKVRAWVQDCSRLSATAQHEMDGGEEK